MKDNRIHIVVDDKIPFLRGVLEPYASVSYYPGRATTLAEVREAEVLITRTRTVCDERLLEGSSVRLITTATIGHDHIDTRYCNARGIRWVNAPGCNASSVQQYVVAALLRWAQARGRDLRGLTLGVVGVGNVGGRVVQAGRALGMNVLENDPPRAHREGKSGFVELEELLAQSDIITCHTPLVREGVHGTYHLMDDAAFGQMRQGVLFVNTGRGEVVHEEALRRAFALGRVSDYVLDVWEKEPRIDKELMRDAFIATPHIAGYSADGKANGTAACVREIARVFGWEGLMGWSPTDIPPPQQARVLAIEASGKSDTEVAAEAVLYTYSIEEESERLKRLPETFERQREEYGVRREFSYFTLRLLGATERQKRMLGELGFRVE